MKAALPLTLALLLGACFDEEPSMTFGLGFRFVESAAPEEPANEWCLPPGQYDGSSSASSIDIRIGDTPPHLFVEAYPDAEEDVYRVQLYTASERDGLWWKPSAVLAERSYDAEFGQRGAQDSIVVDFEGRQYTVEVQGLPASTQCP